LHIVETWKTKNIGALTDWSRNVIYAYSLHGYERYKAQKKLLGSSRDRSRDRWTRNMRFPIGRQSIIIRGHSKITSHGEGEGVWPSVTRCDNGG